MKWMHYFNNTHLHTLLSIPEQILTNALHDTWTYLLILLSRGRPQFLGLRIAISLNSTPALWGALLMNDLTDRGLTRCWIFLLLLFLLDLDSCLTLWFWTAIVLRKRKWIWRSVYIDLLLVVCWNVNSPECVTHWDRAVLFIMDKIVLFHFNNLLVVTPVTGFLKHSRMPAIVICISMSRHLSAVAITGHCHFLNLGTILRSWSVQCSRLSLSHRHACAKPSNSCWELRDLSIVYV